MEGSLARERLHAAMQVAAMLLFIPLALIATLAAILLLSLIGFGFAFADGFNAFGAWAVGALGIAIANAIGAIAGMQRPTRSALLRYLSLSGIALATLWLVRPA